MNLSYGILFSGEKELLRLLTLILNEGVFNRCEVVILEDSTKPIEECLNQNITVLCSKLESVGCHTVYVRTEFDGDFSLRRNELDRLCSGDWVFQIDADEYLTSGLFEFVRGVATQPSTRFDALAIARENFVAGMPEDYAASRGWKVDAQGRVNWPDWQLRMYKRREDIFWVNRVHETLCLVDRLHRLDPTGKFLIHHKSFSRQKAQNSYYESLTG